jgi:hypothetical protein
MALIIRGDELPDETLDESDIILDQFIAASQRCRAKTNQISQSISMTAENDSDRNNNSS